MIESQRAEIEEFKSCQEDAKDRELQQEGEEKSNSKPVYSDISAIDNTLMFVLGKEFDWKRALGITALTSIFWNLAYRPSISRLQNETKKIKVWPAALAAGVTAVVVQGYNYFFGPSDDDFEPVTTPGAPRVRKSRKGSKKSKTEKVTYGRVIILKGIICGILLASLSVLCLCFSQVSMLQAKISGQRSRRSQRTCDS